jgi:glycosyltransferase involved in cell wall biosynthesis
VTAHLHIALYFSGLSGGGAQRRMLALAGGFVARGHRVDVVVAGADGPFRSQVPARARVVDVRGPLARTRAVGDRRALRVLATVGGLRRYLARERPDVVLSTSNAANLTALIARRLTIASTPVVASVNVNLSAAIASLGRPWRPVVRTALERMLPRADHVVSISRGVAADLCDRFGVAGDRQCVVANPVDVATIERAAREPLLHPWAAPGAAPLVLAVGKLSRQKDYPTLLQAFACIRRRRPANLVILGEGAERTRLERLVLELGIGDFVSMPGFVPNPHAWVARASVFVLASAWEGFSNVLAEALACGCSIVSSDCPSGPAELLGGGRFGALVEPGNADALAEAVLTALDVEPDRELLRARAAEFGLQGATDGYLAVLGDVARVPALAARAQPRVQAGRRRV